MATIGVKIELEGAPQYVENMKNLTAQTKLYQAQMKRLTQELSGASAFTKSIATTKALTQQLEAQKNQARLLEEQIAKTSEKYGEDSTQVIKLKTQYENLQTQIAKTTQALEDQGGIAGAISAQFEEVSNKIGTVSTKVASVGDELTKKITAPILAMGTASVAAFNEVDGAMDTIITKTGATGKALEGMEDVVENIATSIPTSFDTAANAVGEVNTRFGATGEQLEELSTAFIKFSELNNTDVSNSVDNVQKALESYNLGAESTIDVLDRINKVGQDTGISVDKLATGVVTNAAAFQELGLGIEESITFMGQLEKSGANADTVLGGMRKALKNAAAEGKPLSEALAELQHNIEEGTGSIDGLTAAYDIFGKSGDQIYNAVKNGSIDFENLAGSMDSAAGSVADTFEATLDPVDELQQHMNELKLLGTDVANQLMPAIKTVMTEVGNTIKSVSDAWGSLSEEQQGAITKMLGVTAIVGPILKAVSSVISSIQILTSGIGKLIAFWPKIQAVMTAVSALISGTVIPAITAVVSAIVPFLPVIAGVAAAIAALIVVIKNWATITDFVSEKWNVLKEFLGNALSEITAYFNEHFGIIGQIFTTHINIIATLIKTTVEVIGTIIKATGNVIKALFTGDWNTIGKIVSQAWNVIKTTVSNGVSNIINVITNMGNNVRNTFSNLLSSAWDWGSHFVQNFCDGITSKMSALIDKVRSMADTVRSYLHFSHPDIGPLKDANKWPRDFVQQYAQGIESARYLIQSAVGDVAADIAVLQSPIDSEEVYSAIRSGASDATIRLAIGDREFGRALRDMGVVFNG